uniref:Pentatricopeptide repeat-containing protein n=1 Tax=Oryza barthii TaxID=65489 RepID=A0A0D3HFB8_9ORYZ
MDPHVSDTELENLVPFTAGLGNGPTPNTVSVFRSTAPFARSPESGHLAAAAASLRLGISRRVPALSQPRATGAPRSEYATEGRGGRAGGSGAEDARHVFDELLRRGRGASIYGLNRALTAVARDSPAAAVACYNCMARSGAKKVVAPDLCTHNILISCCCRAGRLDVLGFRVNAITINTLLKGLCAEKRTNDALDIVLRRMAELGCIPNVFSYSILLKGLCDEERSQ